MIQKLKKLFDPDDTPYLREDRHFMPDVEAAIRNSGHRLAYIMSITTAACVILFIIWASLAVIDEVTKGEGTFIPSSRTQQIQSLDGGIVSEILVHEGDIVEPNQVLVKIDNTTAETNLKERQARYDYLRGMSARLDAEINDKPLSFPEDLKKSAPDVITDQINQYSARRSQQSTEVSVLETEITQKNGELKEMQARMSQLRANLALKQQELDMRTPLVAQGAMSKVELLRVQGEVTDLKGELNTIQTALPRANAAVAEASQRVAESKAKFKADAQQELAASQAEMASLQQVLTQGNDKVNHTQLRSPVKGTVKQIKINTVGGVAKPGEDIMDIVPLDDTLMVEAKIPPKDIAFIHPGENAIVKVTAYDYSIFGGLHGTVEGISADTIQNEKGESFYRVTIRTKENIMMHDGKSLPIIPGMTASVQIQTGRKSVLSYLLKPIMKARQEALRER